MSFFSKITKRTALFLVVTWCLFEFDRNSFSAHAICDSDKCEQYCLERADGEKCLFLCNETKQCNQYCAHYGVPCLLSCNNAGNCDQDCYHGYDCDLTCEAREKATEACRQNCSNGSCSPFCDTNNCKQVCDDIWENCYARCTDFETCSQDCKGESCGVTCNSKKCDQKCHHYACCTAVCGPDVEDCTQECSFGDDCRLTCDTGIETCSQNCSNSKSCQITCNSKKCNQVCAHEVCVATCGPDVEECSQECINGNCVSVCNAKNCTKKGGKWVQDLNQTAIIKASKCAKQQKSSKWSLLYSQTSAIVTTESVHVKKNSQSIQEPDVSSTVNPSIKPTAFQSTTSKKGLNSNSSCLDKRYSVPLFALFLTFVTIMYE